MVNEVGDSTEGQKSSDQPRSNKKQIPEGHDAGAFSRDGILHVKVVADQDDLPSTGESEEGTETPEVPGAEDGEPGDTNSQNLETAQHQAKVATAALTKLHNVLDGNRETWESLESEGKLPAGFFDNVKQATSDLVKDIERLVDPNTSGRPGDGLAILTTASAVDEELRDLDQVDEASGSGPVAKLVNSIKTLWNKAMRWLKSIISRLLTPKEWTISGGVTMLGWANAQISVTFGS